MKGHESSWTSSFRAADSFGNRDFLRFGEGEGERDVPIQDLLLAKVEIDPEKDLLACPRAGLVLMSSSLLGGEGAEPRESVCSISCAGVTSPDSPVSASSPMENLARVWCGFTAVSTFSEPGGMVDSSLIDDRLTLLETPLASTFSLKLRRRLSVLAGKF